LLHNSSKTVCTSIHTRSQQGIRRKARGKLSVKIVCCEAACSFFLGHEVDTFDLVFTLLVDLFELVQVLLAGLPIAL